MTTALDESVKAAIEQAIPGAQVQPAPFPPHVAQNICKMLERVQVTGPEAIAWCEAYQLVQQYTSATRPAGVPFSGLPGK